ncbi:WD40 repeat domain-containing protein [Streptomyces sp. NPDC127105]|uniref:WD40 repeat domain-containing protein n=1 Tax=Streptomyces sp. NPDC127105 TaxID=3345359 RepID=UPI0036553464
MRIWNPAAGAQEGKPLTGHTNWVRSVLVFTAPDGTTRLATASRDQTVRIWNPRTRTGYVLPLTDKVHNLKVSHGLLLARTSSGYLVIDVASVPTDAA